MFKKALIFALVLILTPFALQAKSAPKPDKVLQINLKEYGLAVRWNDFEMATESLDPLLDTDKVLAEQDEAYYKNYEISGYSLKTSAFPDPMNYTQRVELRIIDRDTQIERTKVDKQSWRYDATAKRWWLTSGLPKLD